MTTQELLKVIHDRQNQPSTLKNCVHNIATNVLNVCNSQCAHSVVVYQLGNRFTPTNKPKPIGSKLHLSLTSTVMTNSFMIMGQNELSDIRVFWMDDWVF